jgi:ABC-type Zn uptake system ZnuABC Zn-binding protein ZnuA
VVVALLVLALVAGACGGSSVTTGAPVLTVVTGLWPLAAAASEIGQGNVAVDDVVPPGDDPRTTTLSAGAVAKVHSAGLVLELGGGFQPSFEAAAASAPTAGSKRTVRLLPPGGASLYVWLNPYAMEQTGATIAAAMEKADPKAAPTFETGLANYQAELGSLDADYQSSLSTCPDQILVTVDNAFAGLHPRYPVTDRAIVDGPLTPTPSAATVREEVAAIKASGAKKIYTETWIPESDILGASAEADVQVGTISTLEGPPTAAPWLFMAGKKYESLMEANLSVISAALHCPNADEN